MVQLFNAVRKHQQNLDSQLKERRKDKVMKAPDKRMFLDILLGHSHSESVDSSVKFEAETQVRDRHPNRDLGGGVWTCYILLIMLQEEEEHPTWPVLHDDFMIGTARLKDWDKVDSPT
jgi:hypothetical protein